jgi:iron complex outermembrane recepter protein
VHLLDTSLSWRCGACRRRAWSATLGVANLTDELYLVSGNQLAVQGPVAGSYARPREWFLTVGVDF